MQPETTDIRVRNPRWMARVAAPVTLATGAATLAILTILRPGALPWGTFALLIVLLAGATLTWTLGRRLAAAHELALVAAMAALATAGRVLFASLPNFKPVTIIILVSGAALGPRAGFMAGATTGLVSNLFFGQGPWTPWQMLAWGLVGLAGGALGRHGRVPSRWTLALVGGALALAFDWFVSLWMFLAFTNHSLGALFALYLQGAPFDVAHVAATVLGALAFGPQAIRILARFRARTSPRLLPLEDTV